MLGRKVEERNIKGRNSTKIRTPIGRKAIERKNMIEHMMIEHMDMNRKTQGKQMKSN